MEAEAEAPPPNLPLPPAFIDFLHDNGLNPSIYASASSLPRYIRLKPGTTSETQIAEIESELGCELEKVDWLPGFFAAPPHIHIAGSVAYKRGKIYGMDVASGAAVMALDVSPGDHVLDLCAAPGAKLCMLLDLLGSSGSLTGVDVARHRLAACRTMLLKYGLGDRCRLFVADGTSFSFLPVREEMDMKTITTNVEECTDALKEWSPKRSWKERKSARRSTNGSASELVRTTAQVELLYYGRHSGMVGRSKRDFFIERGDSDASAFGYDRVLVDAECTHDGSFKHIQKFEHWGWDTLQRRVLNAERSDSVTELQLQLLTNGFKLLKVGGSLIYSTCSLTVAQNEDVLKKFLSMNPAAAELVEIEVAKNWPCKSGQIPKTLRFDPLASQTSGLFIAKITKISQT
ncbi:hypothetical protein QJS10_CPB11g01853 [Acorus calamus]|uniref:SAM-dependent MTase RsmB/NOP-type domain-containing protein n=1 Tax=Acorus calamus TaxID=4465 RepID=A0AAV9DSX5_ACOCL|nr:hypothetical protein QJS10_CPB11g01853 [Acorus calamus]